MSNQSQSQSQSRQAEADYFDVITTGVGYLNRYRKVTPDKGPAYLCCTVNALVGPKTNVEYREFDVRIVGWQALEALEILGPSVQARKKVLVTFRIGDAQPSEYTFQKTNPETGHKEPVTRYCNKGRLLQVTSAQVDGVVVELPQVEQPGQAERTGTDN